MSMVYEYVVGVSAFSCFCVHQGAFMLPRLSWRETQARLQMTMGGFLYFVCANSAMD
ncbi:uncharacterized protein LY89DRAFT_467650 [Mollisia scopiformis]|uniref:Uncharacterized protein n=1 Tax=Mollisia scopiformis TaxID=149040 RepID=A0A194XIC4_MOLSC|nr:uncharacterized protein LY89DRAFT_467650 [Mollisia scopiformis]KUJ19975.1 hypothetical protein LY89DRAFT_467650 [Mollisia scopiformis]